MAYKSANTLNCLASANGVIVANSHFEKSGKLTSYTSTKGASNYGSNNVFMNAQVEKDNNGIGIKSIGVFPGQVTYFTGTSAAAGLISRKLIKIKYSL